MVFYFCIIVFYSSELRSIIMEIVINRSKLGNELKLK